jgi:hypothetical protein
MCQVVQNPADRLFARRCQKITGLSLIGYLACAHFIPGMPTGRVKLVLAGLAGAFFFTLLISSGLLVLSKKDEFQRILLTRSFLWATVITMGFAIIWGFVDLFSPNSVPHIPLIFLPMILISVTAGAKLLIFRQYRSPSE